MLRTLERRSLVRRRASTGDRRHRDLEVTEAGQAALTRLFAQLDNHSPLMVALSHEDRVTLHDLLVRMLEPSGEAAGAAR